MRLTIGGKPGSKLVFGIAILGTGGNLARSIQSLTCGEARLNIKSIIVLSGVIFTGGDVPSKYA